MRGALTDDGDGQDSLGARVAIEGGYRAKFEDGGDLTWFAAEASIDHVFAECPGSLNPFADPNLVPRGCDDLGCGCVCTTEIEEDLSEGTWSREDSTLTLTVGGAYPIDVGYCVAGDEMTLYYTSGRTVVLERVYEIVTPPQSSCTLGEYDEVPGCTFAASAHCEGTPDACWSMSEDACEAQVGCEEEWSCGGDPVPCEEAYGQDMCDELVGCTYDEDTYECQGTEALCEDLDAGCGYYGAELGCVGSPCSGTATACEELDSLTCGTVQGCTLVVD